MTEKEIVALIKKLLENYLTKEEFYQYLNWLNKQHEKD